MEPLPAPKTPPATVDPVVAIENRRLSTRDLLKGIFQTGSLLVSKEIELARAEMKADIEAELGMVKLLAAAAVAGVLGVNLLLVAAVFALALVIPGWAAALALAAVVLAIAVGLGIAGWRRRVSRPLAVTRNAVAEDLQWAKERLA